MSESVRQLADEATSFLRRGNGGMAEEAEPDAASTEGREWPA